MLNEFFKKYKNYVGQNSTLPKVTSVFMKILCNKVHSIAVHLAPVVRRLDNTIHRINRYPVDKFKQSKPRYPLDSDLSGG